MQKRPRKSVGKVDDDTKPDVGTVASGGGSGDAAIEPRRSSRKSIPVLSTPLPPDDADDDEVPVKSPKKRGVSPKALKKSATGGAGGDDERADATPTPKGRTGKAKSPKTPKTDDEGDYGDGEDGDGEDGEGAGELARSQTQYAKWHQQPEHLPSHAKRGVKIVVWNVNGLRAIEKKGTGVKGYVAAEDPGDDDIATRCACWH